MWISLPSVSGPNEEFILNCGSCRWDNSSNSQCSFNGLWLTCSFHLYCLSAPWEGELGGVAHISAWAFGILERLATCVFSRTSVCILLILFHVFSPLAFIISYLTWLLHLPFLIFLCLLESEPPEDSCPCCLFPELDRGPRVVSGTEETCNSWWTSGPSVCN